MTTDQFLAQQDHLDSTLYDSLTHFLPESVADEVFRFRRTILFCLTAWDTQHTTLKAQYTGEIHE